MSDAEQLFWVLTAFTAATATVWVRPGGTLFVAEFGGRYRPRWAAGRALLRNDTGALLTGNLFPTGRAVVAAPWPVTVSPTGVLALAPSAPTPDERASGSGRYVAFTDFQRATTDGSTLLLDGTPFATAATKATAARWAEWLTALKARPEADRGAEIERALAESCDAAAAGKVAADCRRRVRWVRLASCVLFVYCFAALGGMAFGGWEVSLAAALPWYFALLVLTYLAYRAAGGSAGDGWVLLVSPMDAFRAADRITRPLLERFHPLALSRALCDPPAHAAFARRVARDLAFPLPPPALDPAGAAAADWFAERQRRAIGVLIADSGLDPAELTAPPTPDDTDSVAYCPRCHGQFVRAAGECPSCGIPLRAFAAPPAG